ncbi:hypothetical protein DYBT9275_02250 [Dyadobacter sp. CECT 9275]|uniref:Uncharacterized protein n=1 Tax=Dyadobacter helix TaxID=2822344 RepID=A0A916JAZ5_9BACT|nr:hypothetical protein DYBT9275_02250 [Dyadobacter sp. CECT 9275]
MKSIGYVPENRNNNSGIQMFRYDHLRYGLFYQLWSDHVIVAMPWQLKDITFVIGKIQI